MLRPLAVFFSLMTVAVPHFAPIAQEPAGAYSFLEIVDKRAERSTDASGAQAYGKLLTELLSGQAPQFSSKGAFANRLAQAELREHLGQKTSISESQVADAFNMLISTVGGPPSLHTNAKVVKELRASLADQAPHLISIKRSGTNCNPGEAAFLVFLLIYNDGSTNSVLYKVDGNHSEMTNISLARIGSNAEFLLRTYLQKQSGVAVERLFNSVGEKLNF